MIEYVVVWLISFSVQASCIVPNDPYTGRDGGGWVSAWACYEGRKELKTKSFDTLEEAQRFVNEASEGFRDMLKIVPVETIELGVV